MLNQSGITPIEFNVLVKPDKIEDRTAGGLYKPQTTLDQDKHRATQGEIVAVSELSFNEDIWPSGSPRPAPGQRVVLARHSGSFIDGADGNEYRLVKDKDVVALLGPIQ